jgi:hypothetical protein
MAIRKRWDGETGVVDINFEFMVRLVDDAIDTVDLAAKNGGL